MSGPASSSSEFGRFLKASEVARETSLHRATIYRRVRDETFPPPVDIGGGRKAWTQRSIEEWKAGVVGQRS
jgi:prophage regulatory protein